MRNRGYFFEQRLAPAGTALCIEIVLQQPVCIQPHVRVAMMVQAARVVSRCMLAHQQIADRLRVVEHPLANFWVGAALRQYGRGQQSRRKMPPTRFGLQLFQSGRWFGGEPRFHAPHAFLEVSNVGLLERSRLRPQPAIQERAPFGIHLWPGRLVTVGGENEPKTLRHAQHPVDFFGAIVIPPTLAIVRVAAAVLRVAAAAYEQEWPRRGQRQQLMVIVLETRAGRIGIQQAQHRVLRRRNIREWP